MQIRGESGSLLGANQHVPSRLIGERLQVRLYHDHLALYVGQQQAEILPHIQSLAKTEQEALNIVMSSAPW